MDRPDNNSPYRRRRHRPFGYIGTAVTTALAVYGTYHLAIWAWNTWNQSDDDDDNTNHINNTTDIKQEGNNTATHPQQSHQQKRRHVKHRVSDRIPIQLQQRRCMVQCRRQTSATLAAFNTMLFKKIEEGTDTTMVRRQLKEIRNLQSDDTKHQESILWMTIQVETVTRLITMAYATTLLFTTLTIQVYRLGGRMYYNHIISKLNDDDNDSASSSISELDGHAALLKSFDAFWETDGGLDDLLVFVRTAVQTALKSWNIHDPAFALQMSYDHIVQAISQIRTSIEAKGDLLQRFMIMNDSLDTTTNNTEPAVSQTTTTTSATASTNNELLDELYDLLESPVANDAIRDALQCVFTILQEQCIAPIFNNNSSSNNYNGKDNKNGGQHNVRPLPHVISQLKVVTNTFKYSDSIHESTSSKNHAKNGSNIYVTAMEQLPSVQEAAHISFGTMR